LIEYRSRSSGAIYDQSIQEAALLVWHVDDSITAARGLNGSNTVNTGSPHYGVSNYPGGWEYDFKMPTKVMRVTHLVMTPSFTDPQSDDFAGQPSGITVINIARIGTSTRRGRRYLAVGNPPGHPPNQGSRLPKLLLGK